MLDFGIDDTTAAGHSVALDDDMILFSSDMYGGEGGKDLWVISFDKKAKLWGPAKNLGQRLILQAMKCFHTFMKMEIYTLLPMGILEWAALIFFIQR